MHQDGADRQGDYAPYDELVAQFQSTGNVMPSTKNTASSVTQLQAWLSALTHVAPSLDRTCVTLVESVTEFPWLAMPEDIADAWVRLVCSIVSARSEWVSHVASLLFQNMNLHPAWCRGTHTFLPGHRSAMSRRQLYSRLHSLLQTLLRLIPTLPATLQPLLIQHFPHKRESTMDQVLYIQNLLRITEYCEALTEPIWNVIIDHTLQIDVAIQVELDELEEQGVEPSSHTTDLSAVLDQGADSDSESATVSPALAAQDAIEETLDTLEDLSDEEGYDDSDGLLATELAQEPAWNEIAVLAGKLDAIMKAVHDFLEQHIGMARSPAMLTRRYQLYQTLLGIFTRTILTTFKSRHVQFVLFWFASLDHEFADMFLGTLLSKSLYAVPAAGTSESGESAIILRIAAASYVASYVARARYIDASTTRMVVVNLCTYMDACLESFAAQGLHAPPPGAREHAVFYAVTQAVFYIFCFRWRDLRDGAVSDAPSFALDEDHAPSLAATYPNTGSFELSPQLMPVLHASSLSSVSSTHSMTGERGWAPGLAVVQRAITSPLNPLRYCNANVVQQFAYVAQYTDFLYCYSVLEANAQRRPSQAARESTPTTRSPVKTAPDAPAAVAAPALDAFFPFDPYRLRDSSSLVYRLYREWSDVAPEESDGEEDEDSDDGISALPHEQMTRLSAVLKSRGEYPSHSSITPESIAQSMEAMSISPYTG